ncbi:hypothetical protein ISN45_Aa07g005040, partial [Arabidopsis thaliana x Arabidopsis arenosa]
HIFFFVEKSKTKKSSFIFFFFFLLRPAISLFDQSSERLITDVLSISRDNIFNQSSSVFSSCLPNFTRSKIAPPKRFHRRILSTASKDITRLEKDARKTMAKRGIVKLTTS